MRCHVATMRCGATEQLGARRTTTLGALDLESPPWCARDPAPGRAPVNDDPRDSE